MPEKIFQGQAKIIGKQKIGKDYFSLRLACAPVAAAAVPGQFVQVRVADGDEPLLRRPFGVHRVKGKTFDLLCEVVGEGSRLLSQKKVGEYLDVIGPLGKGFDFDERTRERESGRTIIIAGGMGVAPLLFLADKLTTYDLLLTTVLIGAETKQEILCEKEFQSLGSDVKIATDDGSRGFRGKVTDLLKNLLTTYNLRLTTIYACGPRPMLKEIAMISARQKIPAQISLEEHLSCGIGACLGCAVKTKTGYQRVCKEGPVFNADEIIW